MVIAKHDDLALLVLSAYHRAKGDKQMVPPSGKSKSPPKASDLSAVFSFEKQRRTSTPTSLSKPRQSNANSTDLANRVKAMEASLEALPLVAKQVDTLLRMSRRVSHVDPSDDEDDEMEAKDKDGDGFTA